MAASVLEPCTPSSFGESHHAYTGFGPPAAASDYGGVAFNLGDVILNVTPTPGSAIGWRCTTAGLFGTAAWDPMGGGGNSRTTTAATGILATDSFVLVNTAGGALANALPAASAVPGKHLFLKRSGASNATFTATAIDAGTTITLGATMSAVEVVSDGTQWWVVAAFGTVTVS